MSGRKYADFDIEASVLLTLFCLQSDAFAQTIAKEPGERSPEEVEATVNLFREIARRAARAAQRLLTEPGAADDFDAWLAAQTKRPTGDLIGKFARGETIDIAREFLELSDRIVTEFHVAHSEPIADGSGATLIKKVKEVILQ